MQRLVLSILPAEFLADELQLPLAEPLCAFLLQWIPGGDLFQCPLVGKIAADTDLLFQQALRVIHLQKLSLAKRVFPLGI